MSIVWSIELSILLWKLVVEESISHGRSSCALGCALLDDIWGAMLSEYTINEAAERYNIPPKFNTNAYIYHCIIQAKINPEEEFKVLILWSTIKVHMYEEVVDNNYTRIN